MIVFADASVQVVTALMAGVRRLLCGGLVYGGCCG